MIRCLVAAAFVIAATSGCVTNGDTSSSGGVAADAGSVCESAGEICANCITCAQMGPCSAAVTACQADSYCVGLDECITNCGANTDCKTQCADPTMDPTNYNNVSSCVYCTECPTSCVGYASCM